MPRFAGHLALAALVILAALNRETGVLLPLAYLALNVDAVRVRDWQRLIWGGVYCALYAVIFVGLRLLRPAPETFTVAETQALNAQTWGDALVAQGMLLGIWVLAFMRIRRAPRPLRVLAAIAGGYLVVTAIFGVWREVRLLLPALVLVLPLILYEEKNDVQRQ